MDISIGKPLSFREIGNKDNQEDYVFPSPQVVGEQDKVFIVCDGMGGHSHGEVASSTVATALGTFMKSHYPADGLLTKALFDEGMQYAYSQLNSVDDGAVKKMGTTLTFVGLHKEGCFCAHIGDSRIYIVRPSENRIIYRSEDHSLVNDLIRAGELLPEEAASYPHKNVITRAMQPNQEKSAKAEVRNISDVQSGDYVFLCSDGILENLSDEMLISILSSNVEDSKKLDAIKNECFGKTRDNYTCYLIPIVSVNEIRVSEKEKVQSVLTRSYPVKGWACLVFILTFLLLFSVGVRWAYNCGKEMHKEGMEKTGTIEIGKLDIMGLTDTIVDEEVSIIADSY